MSNVQVSLNLAVLLVAQEQRPNLDIGHSLRNYECVEIPVFENSCADVHTTWEHSVNFAPESALMLAFLPA